MPEVVGEYIDRLITIEMRTRGVPRGVIHRLYEGVRVKAGMPLTLLAARGLLSHVHEEDNIVIATGAGAPIWLPKGETDGPLGAAALARAIDLGLGATPIFLCAEAYAEPINAAVQTAGITMMDYRMAKQRRHAGVMVPIPVENPDDTLERAASFLDTYRPAAMVSIEVKGVTARGTMHYMTGKEVVDEPRIDLFFDQARRRGIFTLGIGDGGNEIGFGQFVEVVEEVHPNGPAIASTTVTDALVVAAISNWGAYGVEAMLAFLLETPELLHSADMERRILEDCVRAGAGDGIYTSQIMMADGQPFEIHAALLTMLAQIVRNGLKEVEHALRSVEEK
ncbi:MAG: DUF4392 domain-containing protein [Chloroflexi bacterium]|nr:DUF4392 domain-containing protein [Chloroflexota bacterium]